MLADIFSSSAGGGVGYCPLLVCELAVMGMVATSTFLLVDILLVSSYYLLEDLVTWWVDMVLVPSGAHCLSCRVLEDMVQLMEYDWWK